MKTVLLSEKFFKAPCVLWNIVRIEELFFYISTTRQITKLAGKNRLVIGNALEIFFYLFKKLIKHLSNSKFTLHENTRDTYFLLQD